MKLQLRIGDWVFPFAKVVEVDTLKKSLFIEEMANGKLRLTYSRKLLEGAPPIVSIEEVP